VFRAQRGRFEKVWRREWCARSEWCGGAVVRKPFAVSDRERSSCEKQWSPNGDSGVRIRFWGFAAWWSSRLVAGLSAAREKVGASRPKRWSVRSSGSRVNRASRESGGAREPGSLSRVSCAGLNREGPSSLRCPSGSGSSNSFRRKPAGAARLPSRKVIDQSSELCSLLAVHLYLGLRL